MRGDNIMDEIKEPDNNYIVVKWEDVFNPNFLTTEEHDIFKKCLYRIGECRKQEGKHDNRYVVLNLDDEADIDYLITTLESRRKNLSTPYIAIGDIAVDLVNAVRIAGNP